MKRAAVCAGLLLASMQACALYRPAQEWRSITTPAYEVIIQKNGRVDVCFSSGVPVFDNALPAIRFAGKDRWERLKIAGRASQRTLVQDALGEGKGTMLALGNCEWRINTYITQPFLTIQVAYVNNGKKPVRVAALAPWSIGMLDKGSVSVGPDAAGATVLSYETDALAGVPIPKLGRGAASSAECLAVSNAGPQRHLIAGFLTQAAAFTRLQVDRSPDAAPDSFDIFSAACIYDPPVEVMPGERLHSEVLYLAIAEGDPFTGLERYAHAVARVAGTAPRDNRPAHGWETGRQDGERPYDQASVLHALSSLSEHLPGHGWQTLYLADGWAARPGSWEPEGSRFPNGLGSLASEIRKSGLRPGLILSPFVINRGDAMVREHPDWLREPNAEGCATLGTDRLLLDLTMPEVYAFIRERAARISRDWGFQSVQVNGLSALMLADSYADSTKTRVQALRLGAAALREGLGPDVFLELDEPLLAAAPFCDGVHFAEPAFSVGEGVEADASGCVEALSRLAQRYYYYPYLFRPSADCVALPNSEAVRTTNHSIAWLTGLAMMGGTIRLTVPAEDLTAEQQDTVRKLTPASPQPARPVDLFEQARPHIWSLSTKTPVGEWRAVGLFNWKASETMEISFSLTRLGLDPEAYYTVYDFGDAAYCGLAQGKLTVAVPAASVRLLIMRPYEDRPMLLAMDSHFTGGAQETVALGWDSKAKMLHGAFEGVAATASALKILAPDSYTFREGSVGNQPVVPTGEGPVITLRCELQDTDRAAWRLFFDNAPAK